MDYLPLVTEQLSAGRRFVAELAHRGQLSAAFWTRTEDDWGWMLYLVSPEVSDRDPRDFIDLAHNCLIGLWDSGEVSADDLDLDRLVFISPSAPLAEAVRRATPANYRNRIPPTDGRIPGARIVGANVPEVYLFGLPAPSPA